MNNKSSAILAERLRRQRLTDPLEHVDDYIDLFRLLQPVSTVANAAIVNEIKVQTAERLAAQGLLPSVLTSSAVVGSERSTELFDDAYRDHARRLARALGG